MATDKKQENRFLTKLKEGISDMFYIWKEELEHAFRDSGVRVFLLIVPLAYPLLYASIYNTEVVREAKLVVVDHSSSAYSREFVRRVDASPNVKVVAFCTDMQEAKQQLDGKKAYGILFLPAEFSRELHSGRQTTVSLYSDLSSMLYYKNFLETATEVSLAMGKEIAQREHPSATRAEAGIKVNPVPYEAIAMFNPQNGFCSFLLPAILILVIQQTLILGICMLGGTAREKNRFGTLVPVSGRYHGTLRIVFGKSLVYMLLYIILCCWILMIVPALFSLPQLASSRTIILFVLPYLFACIFLSMTLSGIMTSRESPMLVFVFTSVILLFLSGVSWPRTAIHGFWRALSYVFPSTPGVQGFVSINTMGATLEDVASSYKLLWLQTGFYFITACLTYRYQIIRSQKVMQNDSSSSE